MALPTRGTARAARGAALRNPPVRETAAFAEKRARGGGGGGVDARARPAGATRTPPDLGSGGGDDAAVADDDVTARGVAAAGAAGLDRLDDVVPFEDLPENGVLAVQERRRHRHRKNCEPLVLGPALAMDRMRGPWWGSVKFSSANVRQRRWNGRPCRCRW